MNKLSILLIGAGGYGENYLKELLFEEIDTAEFVAVADPFVKTSPYYEVLNKKGIKLYSSPKEFYDAGNLADLTIISSPIHTHYEYILTALNHHSYVLCEKPVTIDLEKMKVLLEAEKESGCFVAIGYQMCYQNDVLALKQDVISGLFGKSIQMKSLRLMRRGDNYYSRNGWAGKLKCHGDYVFDSPLSNACAHQVQNMLFLLGRNISSTATVDSVTGVLYKARVNIENFDAAAIKISTKEKVDLYYYTAHCLDEKKVGPYSELLFEKAVVKEDDGNWTAEFKDGTVKDYSTFNKGKKLQKLYSVLECINKKIRPTCTLETAYEHIKVVLLVEKLPVYLRYDAKLKTDKEDSYYAIENLATDYLTCYESWSLPQVCSNA